MKYILIESSVLLTNGKFLSTKVAGYQFVITVEEINKINKGLNKNLSILFKEIIGKSKDEDIIICPNYLNYSDKMDKNRTGDKIYTPLIENAKYLKNYNFDVAIVTNNSFIEDTAIYENIEVIEESEIFNEKQYHLDSLEIAKEFNKFSSQYYKRLDLNVYISLFIIGFITFVYYFLREIVQYITIWVTFVLTVFFGCLLFIIREKFRLAYAISELFVGIMGVYLALPKNIDYSLIAFDFNFGFKLLGGLYIIVRGLDNLVKGLQGKRWGNWLKQNFGIG